MQNQMMLGIQNGGKKSCVKWQEENVYEMAGRDYLLVCLLHPARHR